MACGDHAEDLALSYLLLKKITLKERNFHCKYGEVDLIMRDKEYLVFVEVRYRASAKFGGALESINHTKQAKLKRTAEFYLQKRKLTDSPCRFDILCINGNLNNPDYEWIANAL